MRRHYKVSNSSRYITETSLRHFFRYIFVATNSFKVGQLGGIPGREISSGFAVEFGPFKRVWPPVCAVTARIPGRRRLPWER